MKEYKVKTLKETELLANKISSEFSGGCVVGLKGGLGSGKTTLVKAFAKALGVREEVTSPTFTIIKSYPISWKGVLVFHHVDLYRLKDGEFPMELQEYFGDTKAICFIEWAEKAKSFLPKNTIMLEIKILSNTSRKILKTIL
jgi:tRNA threonylcarbamoyladenosine biosynthesis protein TsaE